MKKIKKDKSQKAKLFFARFGILVFVATIFSVVILNTTTVIAGYYEDHADDAYAMDNFAMYYQAIEHCIDSNKKKSYTIELTSRSESSNKGMKNYYNLNSGSLWDDGSNKTNLLYSATLESLTSAGYKDGKIYCNEINFFPEFLKMLGQYTDETRNKLICNGTEPGMFNVYSTYGKDIIKYGDIYKDGKLKDGYQPWAAGWPDHQDCAGTLNKLIEYVEQRPTERIGGNGYKNTDYAFHVTIKWNNDTAWETFRDVVKKPYVGSKPSSGSGARRLMNYWRYRRAFEVGCGKFSAVGTTVRPGSATTNRIEVYNAGGTNPYWLDTSKFKTNDKVYYDVDTDSQMTCKELAEELGSVKDNAKKEAVRGDAESCLKTISSILDTLEEGAKQYRVQWAYGKGLYDYIYKYITQIKNGKIEMTVGDHYDEHPYDLQQGYKSMVEGSFIPKLALGVNGTSVYDVALKENLIAAYKQAIDEVVMEGDGTTIKSGPGDDLIKSIETYLTDWKKQVDHVESEMNTAEQLLADKRDLVNSGVDGSEGKLWTFDSSTASVKCKDSDLQKEIDKALTIVPLDVKVDPWSPSDKPEVADPTDPDNPLGGTPGTTVEEDPCYANAGSLGWIMCPVITSLDGVLSNFYDTVIEKFLKIEINAAFDNDSATHTAWSIMRDIANIAFVVILLVVILSQLTGFGIDNYGIKRTLPRIIIAAVLVNASFIACQIVIDMSNIIGLSLRQMLENLAPEIKGQPLSGAATIAGFAVETGLGVAIIVLIAKFSVDGWWGIVLVALLAVLAIVIAVFFLFIVLITRQAALIMLVVIAPLAFVCYLLPNTEKLFKKWIDAIKGLLLLYPICSIVVGGGAFAGRVLASVGDASGNWIYSVAAMLIQVMPFFLIPSLTRSSLKGIGNIGEKIGAAGKSFSRAARGTIGNAVRGSQTWRGHHERRGQMLSDNYQDRMMDKSLNANKRGVKIFGKTIHGRNSLMARVAKRDENGKPMKHADGSYVIDTDKLSTLSTSERKMLLAMQARKRDNETIDSRVVSGGHRISPDSIAAQRAQYRAADQAQEVKDKEAQIVDGSFRYDVNINGQTEQRVADPNDIGSLQEALRAELRKDESEVDTSKVKALQNVLSQKGDKGRTAVTEAMTQAQADVAAEHAADPSRKANVSHKARQAYSENINDHWASDYKNNQRSTYEFAQANSLAKQQVTEQVVDPTTGQTTTRTREETDAEFDARIYHRGASEARQDVVDPATGQTRKENDAEYSARLQAQGIAGAAQLSAFQSGNRLKYDSLRANQLADMDDNELERFIRQADANQFQQIQTLAMDALADDSSTNLKTERQRLLANIANMSQADIASNTGGANGGARRNDFNHLMNSPVTSAQIDAARQKAKDRAVLRVQLHNPGGSP